MASYYASVCIYWKWPKPYQHYQIYFVLASCFLVHLSIGTLYTYGNLVPYIVSYVRNFSSPTDLHFTDTPYIYACQIAGQGSSMMIGGVLEKRIGPRLVTLVGGLIMSSGVALSFLTIKYSFWLLLFTYGIMVGVGSGMAYVGPLACAMRWLPKWKGLASGIVVSGFGLSALIFNTVQTQYINPENFSPDSPDPRNMNIKYFSQAEVLKRVPYVFLILSGCYVTMQAVGSILIVNPCPSCNERFVEYDQDWSNNEGASLDEKYKQIESDSRSDILESTSLKGTNENDSKTEDSNNLNHSINSSINLNAVSRRYSVESGERVNRISSNYVYNLSPLQMLSKVNFYLLWIMFFLSGTSVTFISSLYKIFGLQDISDNDHFLSIVGGVSAIFNSIGCLVWGVMADFTTYKVAFVVQGSLMTCLFFTLYSTTVTGKVAFFIWICGIYFCIGGYFSLFPVATARSFGHENVGINYGIIFTSQLFGGVFAGTISQFLVDHIFWYGMLIFIGGLSGLEFILALLYRHKRYLLLPSPKDLLESVSRVEESSIKFPDDSSFNLPDSD